MQKVIPLKRFGQNYLHDKNIIEKIIHELNPQADDIIVEIGPGLGAITEFIYGKTKNFFVVEIDKRVIAELKRKFSELQIISADFLKINTSDFIIPGKKKIRVVGNIPYNRTASIMFKIIRESGWIKDAVFMVQYEVAKRITASKGTKDYGILTVLLNYFADVKFCFKVSHNVFHPVPNVNSAVVHIKLKNLKITTEEREIMINMVKACFGNRRKTLKNSLSNSIFKELNFSGIGIDLSKRAEQLEAEDFVKLTKYARNQRPD